MNKWLYGDSWEKFPIEQNELWIEQHTDSKLMLCDILDGIPEFMYTADMLYSDTPWNIGNVTSFYTKANLEKRCFDFNVFTEKVFEHINNIHPLVCYLEIGNQNLELFENKMKQLYPCVQSWQITYYKRNKCNLIRGGNTLQSFDFTAKDDVNTPLLAMQHESFSCVADLCMGRGLTAIAAYKTKKRFVGTELNKRRLAVTINEIDKLGGKWTKKESDC